MAGTATMRGEASSGILASRGALSVPSRVGPAAASRRRPSAVWIFVHVAFQIACQLALLVELLAPMRVFFRSAAFGSSLLFLALTPGWTQPSHRVRNAALVVILIVTLSAFNPEGGAPLAVMAHWSMNLAILAPLFWVSRLDVRANTLQNLLLVMWAFHTLSSVVGLLQVYFPGQFMPALTTFIAEKQALSIRLASGEWVPRPMGLTDMPGAVAGSGLYAALLGFGVALARPFSGARLAGVLSMVAGVACISLSQIRAMLVMLVICFIALVGLFVLSGKLPRLAFTLVISGLVALLGLDLAILAGGESVTARLATLVAHDPGTVYRLNRGHMVENAFQTLLPLYPLGAGLGHWGMVNVYFGSAEHELGAEVQWVAWLLDGGLPLIIAYLVTILLAIHLAVRGTLRPQGGQHEAWCAVVAACDVGMLALCFSFTPYMSTIGLETWLMNAVLLQSARAEPATARTG